MKLYLLSASPISERLSEPFHDEQFDCPIVFVELTDDPFRSDVGEGNRVETESIAQRLEYLETGARHFAASRLQVPPVNIEQKKQQFRRLH